VFISAAFLQVLPQIFGLGIVYPGDVCVGILLYTIGHKLGDKIFGTL
jgi:hypothetical protein